MAQLNLRDRLIETTVAYVGAADDTAEQCLRWVKDDGRAGRSGALRERVVEGKRASSLDWRPRDGAKLNDCELAVSLVAPATPLGDGALDLVLADADGLVLILEGEREAAAANERVVALVRSAMARVADRPLSVVVQVNERVPGVADPLVSALVGSDWPQLRASASTGEGVVETLQRTVEAIFRELQQGSLNGAAARASAPKAEGNPLLTALREIMRTTVAAEIAALEGRLVERLQAEIRAARGAPSLEPVLSSLSALSTLPALAESLRSLAHASERRDADMQRDLAFLTADARGRNKAWF